MRRSAGFTLGVVAWVVASAATLLLALAFLPTIFGFESLIVVSGSMGRTLPIGSVALTRAVEAEAVGVGDVISFRHRGRDETITHRVIAVATENGQAVFTTKGDANNSVDPEKVVVGGRVHRVDHVVPLAGHVVRYARTPLGGVALIVVPVVGLALDRRSRKKAPGLDGATQRPRKRGTRDDADVGWSTTTYHLVRVSPRRLRSDPGG
jgi:signal peptidase I